MYRLLRLIIFEHTFNLNLIYRLIVNQRFRETVLSHWTHPLLIVYKSN